MGYLEEEHPDEKKGTGLTEALRQEPVDAFEESKRPCS